MLATIASVGLGFALILVALRDVVHELFHPETTGSISRMVMAGVWRVVSAVARRRGGMHRAGPLILLGVATMWVTMLVVGWALVYWPFLPDGFNVNPSLPADARDGFVTALYISLASTTTLSANDFPPLVPGMRMAVALESFVGLVVFTAWITWVLSLHPILAERRAFGRELVLLRRRHPLAERALGELAPDTCTQVLRSLMEQVLAVGASIRQSRVTYYFRNDSPEETLWWQLPYVLALGRAAEARGETPGVRYLGTTLRLAVEELLADVGQQYLAMRDAPADAVLEAIARDHLLDDAEPGEARAKREV
jgi:hypothetical protein